jgi:enoyl-CoA hydratase
MGFENIIYKVRGPMALITINRETENNAITLATLDELQKGAADAAADYNVRVITITGAGKKVFAAGSDLKDLLHRDFRKALEPIVQGLADQLERIPKPTIAAINGFCMGGGLEMALGCDLRIASPNATFQSPEGQIGIIPGGGATARLAAPPRRCGSKGQGPGTRREVSDCAAGIPGAVP